MDQSEKPIRQEYQYRGKILNLRVDDALLPNGKTAKREVVEHPGGVCVAALTEDRRLYLVSAIKLVGLPVLTALVLLPFRLDRVVYVTLVILSGCPTAGINSLFAQSMGRDAGLAARQLTLSTLLCIVTLPLAALLARTLAG